MLDPENRHLLTDALRPPAGHTVEAALATTYTLDLHSLLLAPLAMAAYDGSDTTDGDDAATPIALLESIRRHAQHTTVLCQAAGIHVPPTYPRLAAFAEGMVSEVRPPPGGTFHPKIWLLRFASADGERRHRFVCLSRNLTGDRSWDTVLICDEDPGASAALDADPISDFMAELLEMLVRPLDDARRAMVDDLCATFRTARLAVPSPFTAARAVPLGTPSGASWPLPARADTWAVVSPFLESSALARLPRSDGRRLLLSRADTFDRVGADACGGAGTLVLQAMADAADVDEVAGSGEVPKEPPAASAAVPPRGLHAKLFCWTDGDSAHVLTGSANCTGAAFGPNIEMSVLMSGPRSRCGPDVLLGDEERGLLRLTQAYEIAASEGRPDPAHEIERRIEAWHATVAAATPALHVTANDDFFSVALKVAMPDDPHGLASTTVVRPVGLKNARPQPLASAPSWNGLALHALSPYLVVTTTAPLDGRPIARECVVVCDVVGAPGDRQRRLLRELLATPHEVLRYLTLLISDLDANELLQRLQDEARGEPDDPGRRNGGAPGQGLDDVVLLEPLVRAAARGDDALERAHRLLEDLRDEDGQLPELGEDFLDLWNVVWEANQS